MSRKGKWVKEAGSGENKPKRSKYNPGPKQSQTMRGLCNLDLAVEAPRNNGSNQSPETQE